MLQCFSWILGFKEFGKVVALKLLLCEPMRWVRFKINSMKQLNKKKLNPKKTRIEL